MFIKQTNKKTIVREIRRVYFKNYKKNYMSVNSYKRHATISIYLVIKKMGTWKNALQQAKIPITQKIKKIKINKEKTTNLERVPQILIELHRIKDINGGQYFTQKFYKQNKGKYSFSKIKTSLRCKNWAGLLEKELGLSANQERIGQILTDLGRVKDLNKGRYFTQKFYSLNKGKYSVPEIRKRLGFHSWAVVLEREFGLSANQERKAQILAELRRIKDLNRGRYFIQSFYIKNKEKYSPREIKKILGFETWSALMEKEFGLYKPEESVNNQERVQQILTDLGRVKDTNQGEYFTQDFYKQNKGAYSLSQIKKSLDFTTWAGLLEKELGLYKPQREKKISIKKEKKVYTNDELFDEIKRVWNQLGRRPIHSEMKEYSTIGMHIFQIRFKTWTLCIEKFCLRNKNYTSNNDQIKYKNSKSSLAMELKEIAKNSKKKTLSFDDYKKNGGKYTQRIFRHHFGSWGKALESVGLISGANKLTAVIERDLLLEELHSIWKRLAGKPSRDQIKTLSKYPYWFYVNAFGGHRKIVTAYTEYLKEKKKMI
jgi:Homing endonuclease associated repeat